MPRARSSKPATNKSKAKGKKSASTITIKKLNSVYGPHARFLLRDYLEERPRERKRGSLRTYKVLKPLPSVQEFSQLREKHFTSTVDDHLDSAFGEFEELAQELADWFDNLPETFQEGDKGTQLEEAREVLENLTRPESSDGVGEIAVFYLPKEGANSRPARCADAAGRLRAIVDALNEFLEKQEKQKEADDGPASEDVQALIEELEGIIDEADSVEFPGMYS